MHSLTVTRTWSCGHLGDDCIQLIRHFAVSLGDGDVDSNATDKTIAHRKMFPAHVCVHLNFGIPTLETRGLEAGPTDINAGHHSNTNVPAWVLL